MNPQKQRVTIIRDLTRVVQAGETFIGKVTRIIGFWRLEVLPGREGPLTSAVQHPPHRKVEDAFSVGTQDRYG